MKLTEQAVERKGDNVTVRGQFTDKWKKPARVRVAIDDAQGSDVIMDGPIKDTMETLNCLAQIAWNNGWRPEGFVQAIMAVTTNHKIPKT